MFGEARGDHPAARSGAHDDGVISLHEPLPSIPTTADFLAAESSHAPLRTATTPRERRKLRKLRPRQARSGDAIARACRSKLRRRVANASLIAAPSTRRNRRGESLADCGAAHISAPRALDRPLFVLHIVRPGASARDKRTGEATLSDALDHAEYYRGLSAGYTDAIRVSDIKANILMFFLSLVLGPVIGSRDKYPHFLTLPVLISPFLVVFLLLFFALLPRYPRRGGSKLVVSRTALPRDFQFVDDTGREVAELQMRCAILSHILFWKTRCLQISFTVCLFSVFAATVFLIGYGH